jgi:nucleoside-diphosphate-sugar epimerase
MIISGQDSSIKVALSDLNGITFQGSGFNGRLESSGKITHSECFADQIAALLDPTRDDYTKGEEALKALEFIEQCYARRLDMNLRWDAFKSNRHFSFGSRYNRILIVGASGFLGARLSEWMSLDLNLNIRATVHKAYSGVRLGRLPIELVECDVLDFDQVSRAVRDCDVIINCSRDKGLGKKEVVDFYAKGTRNLLEAACTHGVKRFIHISTAAIHGFKHDENLVDETSLTVSTRNTYIRGKLEAEKIVRKYAGVILTSILRPTLIYGPYSSDWTVQIIERVRNGQISGVSSDSLANLVYVDDVVQAILLCLERDVVSGEPFIINNDLELVHWFEYLRAFANQLHSSLQMSGEPLLVQKVHKSLMLLRDSYSTLREVLSSPEGLGLAARIPIVLKIGQDFVKGEKRQRLQEKVLAQARRKEPNLNILKKYETIPRGLYEVFACRSSFSSARARSAFGFEPEVFVRDGVELTMDWAKWARLLQVETENFDEAN